jgi:hypothetical protein
MKFIKWLITATLPLLALTAQADNLYREGTKGYELAAYAEKVLPKGVSPYFVMASDRSLFPAQIREGALDEIGISAKSQKVIPFIKIKATSDVTALTEYDKTIPERNDRKLCTVIFVKDAEAKIGTTLMHELMHCRIEASEIKADYNAQVSRIIVMEPSLTTGKQLRMFEEVLARAMSLTFLVNEGIKEDGEFFTKRLDKPYPMNPGPKSVKRATHICIQKNACSTDPASLAKKLLDDPEFVAGMKQDMIQGSAYDARIGF